MKDDRFWYSQLADELRWRAGMLQSFGEERDLPTLALLTRAAAAVQIAGRVSVLIGEHECIDNGIAQELDEALGALDKAIVLREIEKEDSHGSAG